MSWQLQSLEALAGTPAVDVEQAEQRSLNSVKFLTQAPTDFLEPLSKQPIRAGVQAFSSSAAVPKSFVGSAAENRRNALSQQLRQVGCEIPEGWSVLLALFPLFPPDQLRVEDAASKITAMAPHFYSDRYETSEPSSSSQLPQLDSLLLTIGSLRTGS